MDRATAKQVSVLLEGAIGKLSEALEIAQRSVPPPEFEAQRRGTGHAIACISLELLDPIYRQFPDLAPPGVV